MAEEHRVLNSADDVRQAVLELTRLARQHLNIYSQDLDPVLFDQQPFLDAVRRLALAHQHARIRVLVRDPHRAIKDGHRLVHLIRRLPSRMAIRVPGSDYQDYTAAFLIVDDTHLLFDATPEAYTAHVLRAARPRARELNLYFEEVWAHGHEHPDLRQLRL